MLKYVINIIAIRCRKAVGSSSVSRWVHKRKRECKRNGLTKKRKG